MFVAFVFFLTSSRFLFRTQLHRVRIHLFYRIPSRELRIFFFERGCIGYEYTFLPHTVQLITDVCTFFFDKLTFFRYAVIPHCSANYGFLILFTNARFFFAVDPTSNIRVLPHTVPLVTHCFLMFANFLFFCQTQIFFSYDYEYTFLPHTAHVCRVCFFDERRFFFRTTTNILFLPHTVQLITDFFYMFTGFFLTNSRFFRYAVIPHCSANYGFSILFTNARFFSQLIRLRIYLFYRS